MADIKKYTDEIKNAVYGEEVRDSIINALNKVNDDNNSYQDIKKEITADKAEIDKQVAAFGDMVSEAKTTKSDLDAAVKTANTAKTNLETATSNANTAKTNLEQSTTAATTAKTTLDASTKAAETATTNANAAKSNLDTAISSADTARSNLNSARTNAEKALSNLNTAISQAGTSKTNLETTISAATTAKTQLQEVIDSSDTAKSGLSDVISKANEIKDALTLTIEDGNVLNETLHSENAQALANIDALSEENFKADEILTGVEDIKAYLGYTDEDIAGICVDYQNKTFKRLAGAYEKNAGEDFDHFEMFGGRKRCIVSDEGTILAWYGDDTYNEDGTLGQVMVYQPAFYYKVVPLVYDRNTDSGIGYHLRKANYYVSTKPKTGFKLHPAFYDENGNAVDYILLSAYEGSMWDDSEADYVDDGTNTETTMDNAADKLCSVAGVKPISGSKKNLNKVNFEAIAKNHGDGWHLETIKATSANQLLMMIELGTMNTQTAIGQGVVSIADNSAYNCASLTGSTSELGNGTGQATMTVNEKGGATTEETASGKVSITYRGVENPWGNIWKHINGANVWGDGSMAGGQLYVAENFTFNESKHDGNYHPVGFTIPKEIGCINAMGYGSEEFDWLLMPSEIGGTSALPVGDYAYVTANLNGYRIALLGGGWSSGGTAGSFSWGCDRGVGIRGRAIGGRLLYVPQPTV